MAEIIPAIIANDFSELNQKLSKFVNITKIVQIDMCDGKFVPSISWPLGRNDDDSVERILNEEEGLPFWEQLDFEFDLMILNAHKKFDFFARLGAKRMVFHLEAETEDSFKEFLESVDPYFKDNLEIGLAINTNTDIGRLDPFINLVDFIQFMGIEKIGFQGEPFDEKVLSQIENLKKKYPEVKISIDGSVNENTAEILIEKGADRLVIGSALLNSYDIRETFRDFESL
jgi:ribulose-phosphate 3-epimerase